MFHVQGIVILQDGLKALGGGVFLHQKTTIKAWQVGGKGIFGRVENMPHFAFSRLHGMKEVVVALSKFKAVTRA